MVIAIDGPSGSGKTSTAKLLAKKLCYYYCDSGSLYRAVTYFLLAKDVDLKKSIDINSALKDLKIDYDVKKNLITLNDINVTQYLREDSITNNVSRVSSVSCVRNFLISIQRDLADYQNIIVDGRDIGTTVFPNADFKFFIDAEVEVRARRRFNEFLECNINKDYKEVLEMIKNRDSYDENRKNSPLRKAQDAIYIDNSDMGLEEQVLKIINYIK